LIVFCEKTSFNFKKVFVYIKDKKNVKKRQKRFCFPTLAITHLIDKKEQSNNTKRSSFASSVLFAYFLI